MCIRDRGDAPHGDWSMGVFGNNGSLESREDGTRTARFHDLGVDGSYQFLGTRKHVVAVNGSYLRERDSVAHDRVSEGKLNASYHFRNTWGGSVGPVSYTHLDVYKRQALQRLRPDRHRQRSAGLGRSARVGGTATARMAAHAFCALTLRERKFHPRCTSCRGESGAMSHFRTGDFVFIVA